MNLNTLDLPTTGFPIYFSARKGTQEDEFNIARDYAVNQAIVSSCKTFKKSSRGRLGPRRGNYKGELTSQGRVGMTYIVLCPLPPIIRNPGLKATHPLPPCLVHNQAELLQGQGGRVCQIQIISDRRKKGGGDRAGNSGGTLEPRFNSVLQKVFVALRYQQR